MNDDERSPNPDETRPKWCVVAPTYNNGTTVVGMVRAVLESGLDVIAVNDGSTDDTGKQLIEGAVAWPGAGGALLVVSHPVNRGKAAALRSGFELAASLKYTHVVTIDTDGQHDPADVAPLLALSRANPEAIVVGTRPITADYPFRSRLGRALSNGLVWLIGGVCVEDSQCGLRVYPLGIVRELGSETSRYAFETEVLARAGWAGVPVEEWPIRCIYEVPGGRVSHFRPWADSASAVLMHIRLLTRSGLTLRPRKLAGDEAGGTLLERALHWMNPLHMWRRIKVDPAERDRLAASMGWGVFVAYTPPLGLKTVLCLLFARMFRLQPLVTLATSSLATPPMGALFWAMSIATGHVLLHGGLPTPGRYNFDAGAGAVFRQVALEWALGGLLCGAVLGMLTYVLVRAAGRRVAYSREGTARGPAAESESV